MTQRFTISFHDYETGESGELVYHNELTAMEHAKLLAEHFPGADIEVAPALELVS